VYIVGVTLQRPLFTESPSISFPVAWRHSLARLCGNERPGPVYVTSLATRNSLFRNPSVHAPTCQFTVSVSRMEEGTEKSARRTLCYLKTERIRLIWNCGVHIVTFQKRVFFILMLVTTSHVTWRKAVRRRSPCDDKQCICNAFPEKRGKKLFLASPRLSVLPFVGMYQFENHWTDFHEMTNYISLKIREQKQTLFTITHVLFYTSIA
jgi:hypothetical protein